MFENLVVELNSEFVNFCLFGGNYRVVVLEVVGNVEVFVSLMRNWNKYNSNFFCKKVRRIVKKFYIVILIFVIYVMLNWFSKFLIGSCISV